MKFQNEPVAIQRALLVASKFGFLRKETFWNLLSTRNVSYKYILWNRLMKSGYLVKYSRIGVAENYYCLSKIGISNLKDQGAITVCKTHPLHFEHDEIVMNFTLATENFQLIKSNWKTERMLRHLLPQEQILLIGRVLDKLPDLLFELNIDNLKLECALEVERSRKSKARYDSFVLSYARDNRMGLVLVAYNDRYVARSIQDAIRRLGYPQALRPIVFCRIKDLLKNPANFEVEVGDHKINFASYVQNIRKISAQRPEKMTRTDSGKNSGHFEGAA